MDKKIIIGIVGKAGSGKDTVVKYLKEKHGTVPFRFSWPIKETLRLFFDSPSRKDQAWIAIEFKKHFGEDIFCKAIERKIETLDSGIITLNGMRYPSDKDFVSSYEKHVIIALETPQKTRWERSSIRGEKSDDDIDFDTFQKMEDVLETEQHIPSIMAEADYSISNEGDLNDLFANIDSVMDKIYKKYELS